MLRAAADGLHRRPHVAVLGQQIPARLEHRLRLRRDRLRRCVCGCAGEHAVDDDRPDAVAVALDDRVRAAELERFFGIQRGVDAAVNDLRAALARQPSDLVAAQGVAGVDADADDVARLRSCRSRVGSRVSSMMSGSPYSAGVAAART